MVSIFMSMTSLLVLGFMILATEASNVVISSNLVAVIAGENLGGLVSRHLPTGEEHIFALPYDFVGYMINGFEDVVFDESDPGLLFAVGAEQKLLCVFSVSANGELQPRSLVYGFGVLPYSGVSVLNDTIVISGGAKGVTLYEFDRELVIIAERPVYQSRKVWDASMLSDVLFITPTLAAFSAEFDGGDCRFGSIMVDVTPPQPTQQYSFCANTGRVPESFAFEASNFPLQSALYMDADQTFMYTAGGTLTVQDPFTADTTTTLAISNSSSLMLAVNPEQKYLVTGMVDEAGDDILVTTDSFRIDVYDLEDPLNPSLVVEFPDVGRISSVASRGGYVAYTTTEVIDDARNTSYFFLTLPEAIPTMSLAPTNETSTEMPTGNETSTEIPAGNETATISPSETLSPISNETSTMSPSDTLSPSSNETSTIDPEATLSPTLSPSSNETSTIDPEANETLSPTDDEIPNQNSTGQPAAPEFIEVDPSIQSANVAMTPGMVVVFAGAGLTALISRQLPDGPENRFPLPFGNDFITGIDDVAIDPDNPKFVFTWGKIDGQACSFEIQDDATLEHISCVPVFADNYGGLSIRNETLIVSGGASGYTTFTYDSESGSIGDEISSVFPIEDNTMYTGVELLSSSTAAMSTEFDIDSENPRYGISVVDLENGTILNNFFIAKPIGSDYSLTPSNYPLETALYKLDDGRTIMFTVNGALKIQDPIQTKNTVEFDFKGFSALTLAINREKEYLLLGGVNEEEEFSIKIYYIGNPVKPREVDEVFGVGRITSIASEGNMTAYSTTATAGSIRGSFYQFFELPELPEIPSIFTPEPTTPPISASSAQPTIPPSEAPVSSGVEEESGSCRSSVSTGLMVLYFIFCSFI